MTGERGYDCHRDHGPYAGVADLLARIAGDHPRLASRHTVELRAIAPRLDPAARPAAEEEPIRFHPARRTACLAYGAAEFVAAWASTLRHPVMVRFDHVDNADETTRELLDALTRRVASTPVRLDLRDGGADRPVAADPAPEAIRAALGDSLARGFYHHAARTARRGRALVTPDGDLRHWWAFTTGLATALAALDRAAEALDLYHEARAATDDPKITMSAAYATAMLYARHLPAGEQDPARARQWLEQALHLAAGLADPRQRVMSTVFYEQGLALLDSRAGEPARALRLIDDGLARLTAVLAPGERPQDLARLRHNRAQVHLALGDPERALADLDVVIAQDPDNCEYYVDRAALHRAAGRWRAAIRDYDTAVRLGPHLPEAYYNRAVLRHERGRSERARVDLERVLAIDPGHLDARIALVNLHLEGGTADAAEAAARAGLTLAPQEPALLCTLGLIRSERGSLAEAEELLSRALDGDPELVEAWTNRAAVRFDRGELVAAVADLDRAVALSAAPVPRYNRGTALARLGRWDDAARDFADALAQPGVDRALRRDLRAELARCRRALAG
ncbi:tetratricopeptide repeat protein [Micromonospora narathiwatensis]|uniref:Tetratricopeptide repeat-containing protein n=1 Tax=Micromonospora narathiwatensis TaxID=299146 RepID=A0A1A8ZKL2_9ACTN|nr:tetratricopeptide repeat protein [Micromonospora narathiwatensis]SBT44401.1 Tetratricopeptide repeat-containing protein [Micromonospora narathiwatensis]